MVTCRHVVQTIGPNPEKPHRIIVCGKRAFYGERCWRHADVRQAHTIDDLLGLPNGAVIVDADGTFYRCNPFTEHRRTTWFPAWVNGSAYDQDFGVMSERVTLPATIVWLPDE